MADSTLKKKKATGFTDRSNFNEKSKPALKREAETREVFEKVLDEHDLTINDPSLITTLETEAHVVEYPITTPSQHLTEPCWRDFKQFVSSFRGCSVTRLKATDEQKSQIPNVRKGSVYYISLTIDPSTYLKRCDRPERPAAAVASSVRSANSNSPLNSSSVKQVDAGRLPPTEITPDQSDNWVECDECDTWRLLPPNVDMGTLGKWKWTCDMNHYSQIFNHCGAPVQAGGEKEEGEGGGEDAETLQPPPKKRKVAPKADVVVAPQVPIPPLAPPLALAIPEPETVSVTPVAII